MNITREQYEADMRKAKAEAIIEYEDSIERWIRMEGPIESAGVLAEIRDTYGPR